MKYRLSILLLLCSIAFLGDARAFASVLLTPQSGEYPLGTVLEYCEDTKHHWRLDDILAPAQSGFQGDFRRSISQYPNFTLSRSAFWLRFTVKNTFTTDEVFVLEYAYPTIDTVEFYRPDPAGQYSLLRTGDMLPYSSREIPHRCFVCHLRLKAGEEQTVYVRIASSGPLIAPLAVWDYDSFLAKEYWERSLNGAYYGIMVVMLVYNLFLVFAVRDRGYVYYVVYLASFLLYQMCLDGSAVEYLWSDAPLWANTAYLFFAAITTCTATLFSRDFLALSANMPRLDRIMQGIVAMSAIVAVSVFFVPYRVMITFTSVLVSFSSLLTLCAALYCLWRGYTPALYFLIAWGTLIIAVFMFSTIGFGWMPFTFWTWYGSRLASAMEVVLLSLGLAYRINLLRKEQENSRVLAAQNTDLTSLNAALHKQNDELQHINTKLDEANTFKTRMVSIVSHDLKNPLNTIRLLADALRPELREDSHEGKETLNTLISQTQHSSQMVEELLDMAALDMGRIKLRREEMDLSALVAAVVFMQSVIAEKKHQSISMALPENCVIVGDEGRLRQVVENLISNAVKFSPLGTTILVRLTAPKQGWVRFSVQDHGPGLNAEDKGKVFGHFQKLSARPTGNEHSSGIGLAIVKQIVELHGGRIFVESDAGEGATFTVELPIG